MLPSVEMLSCRYVVEPFDFLPVRGFKWYIQTSVIPSLSQLRVFMHRQLLNIEAPQLDLHSCSPYCSLFPHTLQFSHPCSQPLHAITCICLHVHLSLQAGTPNISRWKFWFGFGWEVCRHHMEYKKVSTYYRGPRLFAVKKGKSGKWSYQQLFQTAFTSTIAC